jgi:DNA helicase-2/ATP-dependent DNA helicase PcrA
VVLNPRDEIALRRVLNYPARQIGEAALERLEAAALSRNKPLWEAICAAEGIEGLPSGAKAGCREFAEVITAAQHALKAGVASHEFAQSIVERVKLRDDVFAGSSAPQAARRWTNVESLLGVFKRHDQKNGPGDARALAELVQFLTLRLDEDDEPAERAVTMTTMHGAKGLEFQVVFLAGLEEGLMPHARTLESRVTDVGGKSDGNIEEERRLFYVSITRAKDRLYLCRAAERPIRGKLVGRAPSRFLADIPDELLRKRDVLAEAPPPLADVASRGAALLAALGGSAVPVGRPGRRD